MPRARPARIGARPSSPVRELVGPLGRPEHLAGVTRVERLERRLGEHDRRGLRIVDCRALGGRGQDLARLGDRPAPRRDLAAQVLDRDRERQVVVGGLRLDEQRDRPVGQAGEPRRVRGLVEQPGGTRRECRRALVRGARDGVGATRVGAVARLRERRSGGLVGADGGEREVPRAAVGVAVRKGSRQRSMGRPPVLGRRGSVDGRARQDVAELNLAVAKCDEATASAGTSSSVKPGRARSSVCNSPESLAAATRSACRVGSASASVRSRNPRATLPTIGSGASMEGRSGARPPARARAERAGSPPSPRTAGRRPPRPRGRRQHRDRGRRGAAWAGSRRRRTSPLPRERRRRPRSGRP